MVESIPTPGVLGDIGVNVHSTPTLAGQPVFSTGVPGFGDFATGNSASGTMIVNSEAVALELGEVGIVYRTLAKLIDLVIQVTAWLILFAITSPVFLGGSLIWEAVVFWIVTGFLAVLGYPAILETATRGRTVGKLALGLRTVTVQGGPIRFRHAAIRASFELIDLWVTAGSLGMVAIVWSRRHQRFGDMVAGTIVIRQRRPGNSGSGSATVPAVFTVPVGMEHVAAALDISGLSGRDYELVRSYLTRWRDLAPAARFSVGAALATRIAGRINFQQTQGLAPDYFLACVAARYQARQALPGT